MSPMILMCLALIVVIAIIVMFVMRTRGSRS